MLWASGGQQRTAQWAPLQLGLVLLDTAAQSWVGGLPAAWGPDCWNLEDRRDRTGWTYKSPATGAILSSLHLSSQTDLVCRERRAGNRRAADGSAKDRAHGDVRGNAGCRVELGGDRSSDWKQLQQQGRRHFLHPSEGPGSDQNPPCVIC